MLNLTLAVLALSLVAGPSTATPHRHWVFLSDKGYPTASAEAAAIESLESASDPRAVERRRLRRTDPGLFDARDLPVAPDYLAAIEATGADVHVTSRWLNAVSVIATPAQLARIAYLPGVTKVESVRGGRRTGEALETPTLAQPAGSRDFYGLSGDQIRQMNLHTLHGNGYTAAGIVIGILDTGFQRSHAVFNQPGFELDVISEHDFVMGDGNTGIEAGDNPDQHVHGTLILSVIGANKVDELVGGAYDASFVLAKTEDINSETPIEEDNYVAGLEFVEQHGGDVATSSLGYIDWYSQSNLDGHTAVTTIAVNIATANGLYCCTAAGKAYDDDNPATSTLIAPADALQVITAGAVNSAGDIADFSSEGPTADGRVKPELLARGVDTYCVWPYDDVNYAYASGTSLSTPLVATAVACLVHARPSWSVDRMRTYLARTASDQVLNGQPDPLFVRGYGILNAWNALVAGCPADFDADGFVTGLDFDSFVYAFQDGLNDADFDGDGFLTGIDFDGFVHAFEAGCP